MRHEDPLSHNLLARVFTYTPRGREPLENFCTEILAWCLRASQHFRQSFFEELNRQGVNAHTSPHIQISSQVRFSSRHSARLRRGQFDLLVQSLEPQNGFAIVLEVKTGQKIGQRQISEYRKELNKSKRFHDIDPSRRYLVGLTNYWQTIKGLDAQIKWSTILQRCLPPVATEEMAEGNIFLQFKEFLEKKGLGTMTLTKIRPGFSKRWNEIQKVRCEFDEILKKAREQTVLKTHLHKKICLDPSDRDTWLGLYSPGDPYFYIGFGFFDTTPEPILFVHRQLVGNELDFVRGFSQELKEAFQVAAKYTVKEGRLNKFTQDGKIYFGFARILDQELNTWKQRSQCGELPSEHQYRWRVSLPLPVPSMNRPASGAPA